MQVEAIDNRGQLSFAQPITLKHDQLRVIVDLPDDEALAAPAPTFKPSAEEVAQAQATLDKFQSIMSAPLPSDDALPPLSVDYQDRLVAMELRQQLRAEQGRTV
ncbi:MAG: hypothetical protein RL710_3249 [Pseudomonadota bacterium]|jgi:hypothetical protein